MPLPGVRMLRQQRNVNNRLFTKRVDDSVTEGGCYREIVACFCVTMACDKNNLSLLFEKLHTSISDAELFDHI